MIILYLLLTACASIEKPKPPILRLRSLDVSLEDSGLEYKYERCVRTGLFNKCREWEIKKEIYDLNDPKVRELLNTMGFSCKVRQMP